MLLEQNLDRIRTDRLTESSKDLYLKYEESTRRSNTWALGMSQQKKAVKRTL